MIWLTYIPARVTCGFALHTAPQFQKRHLLLPNVSIDRCGEDCQNNKLDEQDKARLSDGSYTDIRMRFACNSSEHGSESNKYFQRTHVTMRRGRNLSLLCERREYRIVPVLLKRWLDQYFSTIRYTSCHAPKLTLDIFIQIRNSANP
jgi:hypothetical protein